MLRVIHLLFDAMAGAPMFKLPIPSFLVPDVDQILMGQIERMVRAQPDTVLLDLAKQLEGALQWVRGGDHGDPRE